MRTYIPCWVALALTACGDDGIGSDPGGGTGTLLVQADVDLDANGADFDVTVRAAGQDVQDAVVTVASARGEVVARHEGGGLYRGSQPGWAEGYALRVEAGLDWLEGSVSAPELPVLLDPDPAVPFDPHQAPDLIVTIRWAGGEAESVRVHTSQYENQDVPDTGRIGIPAMMFQDTEDEVEIRRRNSVPLEGGVPGSSLTASAETRTTIFVSNPF